MSSVALMLKPLMSVHSVGGSESAGGGGTGVILGVPKPRVDWMKFVVCCCMAGMEVSKQITIDRKSASVGYRWRIMYQSISQLQRALTQFQRTMPPVADAAPLLSPPISGTPFDGHLKVYDTVQKNGRIVVVGQPRADSTVPWKGLVTELLMDPEIEEVSKVYIVKPNTIMPYYVWRIVWKVPETEEMVAVETPGPGVSSDGDDYPVQPMASTKTPMKVASAEARETQKSYAQMDMSVEEVVQGATQEAKAHSKPDVVSTPFDKAAGKVKPEPVNLAGERVGQQSADEINKAVQAYRKQFGMYQRPDGKWAVPLDENGRVTKIVLFNPSTLRVAGVKVEEVTRSLIEGVRK